MRYFYWLILVICFALPSKAEPYTAFITADGVAVRSGPGIDFYPVLQLHTGDEVEVYYEQEGWCAVRPPIGSFSWVSAQYVDFGAGNVGTVFVNGLASRIGSEHSDDCDTVQIALKKGESVLILERRETPENSVSPTWLKIAPPNGEFRWIHRSALGSATSIRQVRHDAAATESTPLRIPDLSRTPQPVAQPAVHSAAQPERSFPVPKIASLQPVPTTLRSRATVVDPFQRAFNELQRESYVAMTRPTDDEIFAILIQRAEELHQIAATDHDMEKTYHLLESLQRTRAVRRELALRRPAVMGTDRRFVPSLPTVPRPAAVSDTPPPQRQSVIPAYTPTAAQSESIPLRAGANIGGFDIVGRLGEFEYPLPEGHPPYAVVDEREKIICLISPSATLDLSQYVGQFVGINGVLGFYDKQQGGALARHITARSVKTLR